MNDKRKRTFYWICIASAMIVGVVVGIVTHGFSGPGDEKHSPLFHQIADADHCVIQNVKPGSKYSNVTFLVSAKRTKEIVRAISTAKVKLAGFSSVLPEWKIEFYQGTNYLAKIRFGGSEFVTQDGSFEDETGAFKTLYADVLANLKSHSSTNTQAITIPLD